MAVVVGTPESELLEGTGDDDVVTGLGGNDTVSAFAGYDVLDGGAGADSMVGGTGDDTYYVDNTLDRIFDTYGEGHDIVYASASYVLTGRVIERLELVGLGNISALGNSQVNYLVGNAGNNRLDGAGGGDTMEGGMGDDTYVIDVQADIIIEAPGGGIDTVEVNRHYTLAANFENLTLTGSNNLSGTGNAGNNLLRGNSGRNVLVGGVGADTMEGLQGNDTYYVDSIDDIIHEVSGVDSVFASINWTLGNGVEYGRLIGSGNVNMTGNGLNNLIEGNSGNNVLDGGPGGDIMIGGAGDDTYYVMNAGDNVAELHGEGTDTIYTGLTYSLFGRAVEIVYMTGSLDTYVIGNSLNNSLYGNVGDNGLDGGTGGDLMAGGLGDDTYYVDNIYDNVQELHLQGSDIVFSTVTYSLFGRAVEWLTLWGPGGGFANIDGTGNSLNNTLVGTAGNNVLDGAGGNDTLVGNDGQDQLIGGQGADRFSLAGSGPDTILDFNAFEGDQIDIRAHTHGVANASLVAQSGADVVIDLGEGNWITVLNTSQADVLSHIMW